jgi:hypothetical protein
VIVPTYNHERFVAEAIRSVLDQSYRNLELIVIDDGSTDRTAAIAAQALLDSPLPTRFFSRENRGAPATLNEGATMARGDYLAFLNSDDFYGADRLSALVAAVADCRQSWGYTLVSSIHDDGRASNMRDTHQQSQRGWLGRASNSLALVTHNTAISTGNLFVERRFFERVGGFRDFRYNHDWDFCLRAAALAEPVFVDRPLYYYRIHSGNTIRESAQRVKADADRMLGDFIETVLGDDGVCENPLAPQWPANRPVTLRHLLSAGAGGLVPWHRLRDITRQMQATQDRTPAGVGTNGNTMERKTALVVLGMHRSGTSALARVLNLCGAVLPAKLRPPKLGNNPKGFWEPEDVVELNERLLKQLGASWDRVDFCLPTTGDLVEEFDDDARTLLLAEYQGAEVILIKDPRIGVLAPLWHRALQAAGYRPVYVVPVRHPLEVARSLHKRGDMSVEQGVALWQGYMERISDFADGECQAVYVRFADLLDDWRQLVRRVGDVLDVPLRIGRDPVAVEDFLEPGLRRQRADGQDLAGTCDPDMRERVESRYRHLLDRCQDTRAPAPLMASESMSVPTASFVLCIENNGIREQALLLCESIRRFAGRHRDAPILAFSPRPGLEVDAATRARLAELGVDYIAEPLNDYCPEYGSANRVVAAAWAEAHSPSDYLVVLDSDTVFLEEPRLDPDVDIAMRPVDSKGSATGGPGDVFEGYWQELASMAGMALDCLPYLETTIGGERIRASYNGGLIIARRNSGLLGRWNGLFRRSVGAGMRPYRGTGMNVRASTGSVGIAAGEYWGSNQAALALTAWSAAQRVAHLPASYNIPLHLLAGQSAIAAEWMAQPPAHIHYHWMFDPEHWHEALDLLAQLAVSDDRLAWLRRRLPLRGG